MSGECVISLILSCCNKYLKWQTSVTAQLQLSFIWQMKESIPLRCEGGLTPKESLGSIFLYVLSPSSHPQACPMQIRASQEQGRVCFTWASRSGPCIFPLLPFHGLFPLFVFKPLPFWTPFSYSKYLTI